MNYTKIVHLIGGEKILISEQEFESLVKVLEQKPQGFIKLQGAMVNKSSIAYMGNHEMTSHMNKLEKSQIETQLKIEGKGNMVEKRNEIEKKIAIDNVINNRTMIGKEYEDWVRKNQSIEIESPRQTDDEVINGDTAYYIDEQTGEKMYS
jgi:hypothetical protein